jgi:hypothetical protein
MKYTVKATYASLHTIDVEADNANEAYQKAREMELSQFEQVKDSGVLEIIEAELSDSNFTEDQLAFMKSYLSNVAVANDDVVKIFMLSEDDDEFYKDHSETYSGLADARGVWEDARRYFKGQK